MAPVHRTPLRSISIGTALAVVVGLGCTTIVGATAATAADETHPDTLGITKIAGYSTGAPANEDGGIAEIVQYNADTKEFYLVNGSTEPPSLEIVALPETGYGEAPLTLEKSASVDFAALIAEHEPGFTFGDLTSVAVDTVNDRIYVSVQEADFAADGLVIALDYDGEYVTEYPTGVQPDMVTVSADGRYVLTADEGEPRDGVEGVDPEGTVTIIDVEADSVATVGFGETDKIDDVAHVRGIAWDETTGLMIPRDKSDAVTDFEPEYITLGEDGRAYVSLQENNAIAMIDVADAALVSVAGLGVKNVALPGNEADLLRDGSIDIDNYPAYMMYMPDGIAHSTVDGKTYLFSANEGDAAEFIENSIDVDVLAPQLTTPLARGFWSTVTDEPASVMADVADLSKPTFYGARSFSIWDADDMSQVFDSGSDFETITAERYPTFFNISNDKYKASDFDKRSNSKGPEPENVTVGTVGARTYAFIGLERIGGFMTYDVTDPTAPEFVNYTNTRTFGDATTKLAGDNSPEGLDFVAAEDSPTGKALLLVGFEVGGTVAAYEIDGADLATSTVSISAPYAKYGAAGTATVTVAADGATPTGSVSLTVDGKVAGTADVVDGVATFPLSRTLAVGKHTLAATYSGDDAVLGATGTGSFSVAKVGTTATASLNKTKVSVGNSVTVRVAVKPTAGSATANGNVTVSFGSTKKTVALSGGKATVTLKVTGSAGTKTVGVRYAGTANFGGSIDTAKVTVVR